MYNFFFEKVSILISILIFSHNASLHLRLLYIIFIYRLLLILSSYCILCSFPCTDYLASPNLLCLSTCQTGARLCGIFNIAPLFLSIHYIVYPSLRFNIALYRVYKHFVCRAFFTLKSSFGSIKFLWLDNRLQLAQLSSTGTLIQLDSNIFTHFIMIALCFFFQNWARQKGCNS